MNKKTDKQILFERMHKVAGMPLNEESTIKRGLREDWTQKSDGDLLLKGINSLKKVINKYPNTKFNFTPDDRNYYDIKDVTEEGIIADNGKLYDWYHIIRSGGRDSNEIMITYGNDDQYFYFDPQVSNERNYWNTKADVEDIFNEDVGSNSNWVTQLPDDKINFLYDEYLHIDGNNLNQKEKREEVYFAAKSVNAESYNNFLDKFNDMNSDVEPDYVNYLREDNHSKLSKLWDLGKSDSSDVKGYEEFIKKEFNNYVSPHIKDALSNSKSKEEFLRKVNKVNSISEENNINSNNINDLLDNPNSDAYQTILNSFDPKYTDFYKKFYSLLYSIIINHINNSLSKMGIDPDNVEIFTHQLNNDILDKLLNSLNYDEIKREFDRLNSW